MPREGMRQRRSGRDAGPSGLMRMSIIHWVGSAGATSRTETRRWVCTKSFGNHLHTGQEGGSGPVTRRLDLLYS